MSIPLFFFAKYCMRIQIKVEKTMLLHLIIYLNSFRRISFRRLFKYYNKLVQKIEVVKASVQLSYILQKFLKMKY